MLKKTFVVTMLGSTFDWMPQWIEHVQHLGQYGFEWKIFTPNTDVQTKGNVEIIPMDCAQFNDLVEKKLGVRPNFFVTEKGTPSVHITDFYTASGVIFEDWLKDSNWWGIMNLDVVVGRLDHFVGDDLLETLDLFSDDINGTINGVFCLFRNEERINALFKDVSNWKEIITQQPCARCLGDSSVQHSLYGSDEYMLTDAMKKRTDIRFGFQKFYPFHGHDRMEQHVPEIKLEIQQDGSLYELFRDTAPPQWIHARPFLGHEIAYFHFQRSKSWPKIIKK